MVIVYLNSVCHVLHYCNSVCRLLHFYAKVTPCLKMAATTGPGGLQIHNSWVTNGKRTSEVSIFEDNPEGVPCMGDRFLEGL